MTTGVLALGFATSTYQSTAAELSIEPHILETASGTEVEVEWGEFDVPLYHADRFGLSTPYQQFLSNPGPQPNYHSTLLK